MKVLLDIPDYEFNNDIADKFQDYFNRVKQDIANGTMCGNYELETTDMFLASFKRIKVLPDNATNGDMIQAMFPLIEVKREISSTSDNIVVRDNSFFGAINRFHTDWWNSPYKNESEDK